MSLQNAMIFVGPSDLHGQGVFAAREIEAGEIIEICPLLLFPKEQLPFMRRTVVDDYYFDWGEDGEWYAIALGYGSLYNHSYTPNAEYEMDFNNKTIDFFCIQPILPGEEILINYNGESDNQTKVWFEDPAHPLNKQNLT
jgi:SET domain-containing protein